MSIIKFFVICCLFLFSLCDCNGQRITQLSYNLYEYENEDYPFHQMDDVFSQNSNAYTLYKRALISRTKSKFGGYLSLGAMVVGTLAPIIDPVDPNMYCDLWCTSTGSLIGILSWIFVVPISGTAGIINGIAYNHKKKKEGY